MAPGLGRDIFIEACRSDQTFLRTMCGIYIRDLVRAADLSVSVIEALGITHEDFVLLAVGRNTPENITKVALQRLQSSLQPFSRGHGIANILAVAAGHSQTLKDQDLNHVWGSVLLASISF